MRVLPAFIHLNLSLSSKNTDISACMTPIVAATLSDDSPPGRLEDDHQYNKLMCGVVTIPNKYRLSSVCQYIVLSGRVS